MFDAMLTSVGLLADPMVFLLMAVGIAIGFVVGLLPGIGAVVAIALALPFLIGMNPVWALALLLAIYALTTITGDMTAILLGVPGAPTSAAMVLDGYQLARQGQAHRALGAAVFASMQGAMIGAVLLFLTIPVMRPMVLALASPEMFMLTVLGISMVGALSGRNMVKGLVSGGLGLLLATVGAEAQAGRVRFNFGSLYLLEGIPLLPLVVGLFAIPELVQLHQSRSSISAKTEKTTTLWDGWRDTVEHKWLVLRSSLVGAAVGVVPGLGGAVAQWMTYAQAVQTSKDPGSFGKGNIEGVIAPGAANNSKEGGGLIPTVAFGIPGTATMAVLLGAFVVLGISPGPNMVGPNLHLVYFMVWVLVIANLVGGLFALLFLNRLAGLTYVRGVLIVPIVALLIAVGASANTGSMGDLYIAFGFGFFAWIMQRFGWPLIPLVLGFVLGPRAENTFWLTTNIYAFTDWIRRPLVLVIIAVTLVVVVGGEIRTRRSRKYEKEVPLTWGNLVMSWLAVAFFAWTWWYSLRWSQSVRFFPMSISMLCFSLSSVQAARDSWRGYLMLTGRKPVADEPVSGEPIDLAAPGAGSAADAPVDAAGEVSVASAVRVADATAQQVAEAAGAVAVDERRGLIEIFVWLAGLLGLIYFLGMLIGMPIALFVYYRLLVREKWLVSVLVPIASALAYNWIMVSILGLRIPGGVLL